MKAYIYNGEVYDTARDFAEDSGELPESTLVLNSTMSVDAIYKALKEYGCPEHMSDVIHVMT